MENSIAKFEIVDTFVVTNVGLIFSGLILEGEISSGCFIKFGIKEVSFVREIIRVESITNSNQLPLIGLIIKCKCEDEIQELTEWDPNCQVANIFKK